MSEHLTCPDCGAELPPGSPRNLCPRCLLRQALGSDPSAAAPSGGQSDETTDQVAHGSGVPKAENVLDRPPPELGQTVDSDPVEARDPDTGDYNPESANPITGTTDFHLSVGSGAVIAGRYTLVEKIGEGGMGDVWVAKQTDPVKRKVALKLIKAGMDSKAVLQRFEQERQALAIMEHPNIARVIDGGMTAERRPFFVMELVNGLPLTRFCDEAQMGIRERLELFASICQAVQHAHQKGIIHRDLKPSNILVTIVDGKPVPKVIDFGVAKATAGKLTDESLSTQFGAVVGTLEYMSPEQAGFSGEDIDTRADIYSLGVILYELLTGLRPIDAKRLKKAALTEMLRIIKEEDPSKPSTRLSTDASAPSMAALRHSEPKKLAALLRGELDWVVMKCLEKQRDRRYETANGLARDIQRYLSNEVVEARPPSAGYRVRKFVSRHRGQVLAAGLLLLALLAGVAGTTWGLIREAKANAELKAASAVIERTNADLAASNDRVEARYKIALDAIKTFHTGVSEDFLLKEPQFKALRDRLLKSAAGFYERLATLLGKETDAASRRALAAARFEIADLTAGVGDHEAALALSREVLAAREALAAEPGADPETKADVARSLFEISKYLHDFGKYDDSFATLRRAEALLVDAARLSPSSAAVQDALASCRSHLVRALAQRGKLDEALVACRQARTHYEARNREPGATAEVRNNLAVAIGNIGILLDDTGKPQEAEAELRAAIAINQKLIDEYPTNGNYRNSQAKNHNNLASNLADRRRAKEAEAEYRAALALWRALAEEYPAVNYVQNNVAFVRANLGGILQTLGRAKEAEAEYHANQAVLRKLADEHPDNLLYRGNLAYSTLRLTVVLMSLGRPAEARDEADRAVSLHRAMVEADPRSVKARSRLGESLLRAGQARRALGDPAGAAGHLRQAIATYQAMPPRRPESAFFQEACCHAQLSGLAGRDGAGVSATEGQAEANSALRLLREAIRSGYRDANDYRTETALDSLRNRPEFQLLMMDLAFPPEPFVR